MTGSAADNGVPLLDGTGDDVEDVEAPNKSDFRSFPTGRGGSSALRTVVSAVLVKTAGLVSFPTATGLFASWAGDFSNTMVFTVLVSVLVTSVVVLTFRMYFRLGSVFESVN